MDQEFLNRLILVHTRFSTICNYFKWKSFGELQNLERWCGKIQRLVGGTADPSLYVDTASLVEYQLVSA